MLFQGAREPAIHRVAEQCRHVQQRRLARTVRTDQRTHTFGTPVDGAQPSIVSDLEAKRHHEIVCPIAELRDCGSAEHRPSLCCIHRNQHALARLS